MSEANLNLLYNEIKEMRKEIHELKLVLIPEEEIREEERKEFHTTLKEMKNGKEKNWRDIVK